MKAKLPEYIVNCLLTAGFDEVQVVASMDTSTNPGNSISQVESYIDTRFKGDTRFCNPALKGCSLPMEFPPGHRIRIVNFVKEVKIV